MVGETTDLMRSLRLSGYSFVSEWLHRWNKNAEPPLCCQTQTTITTLTEKGDVYFANNQTLNLGCTSCYGIIYLILAVWGGKTYCSIRSRPVYTVAILQIKCGQLSGLTDEFFTTTACSCMTASFLELHQGCAFLEYLVEGGNGESSVLHQALP